MATPATHTIQPNEPCYLLTEVNHLTRDFKALHRFQRVYVIRNDALAVWEHDLGPVRNFTAPELNMPTHVDLGGGRYEMTETVANAQAYARDHRARGATGLQPDELAHEMLQSRIALETAIQRAKNWNPNYMAPGDKVLA